jgi:hypothetical protein
MQKNEKYKLIVDLVDSPLKGKNMMTASERGRLTNKNLSNNEELVRLLASFKDELPCEVFILLSEMLSFITGQKKS